MQHRRNVHLCNTETLSTHLAEHHAVIDGTTRAHKHHHPHENKQASSLTHEHTSIITNMRANRPHHSHKYTRAYSLTHGCTGINIYTRNAQALITPTAIASSVARMHIQQHWHHTHASIALTLKFGQNGQSDCEPCSTRRCQRLQMGTQRLIVQLITAPECRTIPYEQNGCTTHS